MSYGGKSMRGNCRLTTGIVAGSTFVAIVVICGLLFWRPILLRHEINKLHRMQGVGNGEAQPGSDECIVAIISMAAIKNGMSHERVVSILGKPDKEVISNTGKVCTWIGLDTGGQHEKYIVKFNTNDMATFVPHVVSFGSTANRCGLTNWRVPIHRGLLLSHYNHFSIDVG